MSKVLKHDASEGFNDLKLTIENSHISITILLVIIIVALFKIITRGRTKNLKLLNTSIEQAILDPSRENLILVEKLLRESLSKKANFKNSITNLELSNQEGLREYGESLSQLDQLTYSEIEIAPEKAKFIMVKIKSLLTQTK